MGQHVPRIRMITYDNEKKHLTVLRCQVLFEWCAQYVFGRAGGYEGLAESGGSDVTVSPAEMISFAVMWEL